MDDALRILGINGSRRHGATESLLVRAMAGCTRTINRTRPAIQTNTIHLVCTDLPMFFESNAGNVKVAALLDECMRADGIIIATPVHWGGASAAVVNVLSWMTELEEGWKLKGKAFGCIAHCDTDGGQSACNAMVTTLTHLGMVLAPFGTFYFNSSMADKSENQWMLTDADLLGSNVAELAYVLKKQFTVYNI